MITNLEKEQKMFSLIESWKGSGKTQQAFCKEHDIRYGDFHYWYKKYRRVHQPGNSPGFVQVPLLPSSTGLPVAELIYPDGRRLNFYQGIDATFIKSVLS